MPAIQSIVRAKGVQAVEQNWRWGDQAKAQKKRKEQAAVPIDSECSVFVRNLPYSAEEEDLEAFFSKAGAVVRLPHSCVLISRSP